MTSYVVRRLLFLPVVLWAVSFIVFVLMRALDVPWSDRVAVTAFSSFKNLGLTVVLAFAVFGHVATLPSIVSLVFEILWLAALPLLFRGDLATAASAA